MRFVCLFVLLGTVTKVVLGLSGPSMLLRRSSSRLGQLAALVQGHHQPRHSLLRSSTRLFSSGTKVDAPAFGKEADAKYFEYARLEKDIYEWWESQGYFKPAEKKDGEEPYVIPMPPPNVTGYLHMGHAMFVALQDIMARFHRMRGKATLWLPGTDHAGIATQLLVERDLIAKGTSRRELGREEFLKRVWAWKEEKGGYITGQMRRLGASADWSREKFTLEPLMSEAVTEAFVRLHEKGLVYRGDYLVNWSPNLQTAVSDLEVDYSEEMGNLYYFKYPLADGSGDFIPVATTRPETILGDTAVCVHPDDERYKAFIGKKVRVPMTNREIVVIADEYVDREFGTGALKITPAHDVNDYELGKKHSLPLINVMNKDASINENGGDAYKGLDRFKCREKLWADMSAAGLVIKTTPHMQRVPRSQRGGEIIEPMVSSQWFVRTENMAARALNAVRDGDIKIIPERFDKIWYGWLENIRPWCVSRQLWWGHRIPAYSVVGSPEKFFVARSEQEAYAQARAQLGPDVKLEQEEDVLDTWFSEQRTRTLTRLLKTFPAAKTSGHNPSSPSPSPSPSPSSPHSSGLWPFATVGWPHAEGSASNSDLARFYPASVLETGYDILFFWVARMVMLGLEFTDKAPFHTIYMHGLVRDGQGQKMSKTTGNVIDPLETIDKFGCDALRYSLVTGSTPGQDIPLSMERIESNRNFANKLWNAGKYLQNTLGSLSAEDRLSLAVTAPMSQAELDALPLAERYIVSRSHELVDKVTTALEEYSFGDAGRQIYEFLWDEYADWYIEISKTRMRENEVAASNARRVLVYVWDRCMRLLHPFMPFLTEALWQLAPHRGDSIMVADWPQRKGEVLPVDAQAVATFGSIQALVRSVRNARAEYNVEPGKKIAAFVVSSSASLAKVLDAERAAISLLGRVDDAGLVIVAPGELPASLGQTVHLIVEDGLEVFLPMSALVDAAKELARLGKQAEKLKKDIDVLETRLTSKGFADKAPESVINEVKGNIAAKKEELAAVEKGMATIGGGSN